MRFQFGEFELDADRGVLLRNGREVALRPKCFLLLQHLLRRQGKLVGKEELMEEVWPDVIVSDSSVSQCLVDIRRAIGDGSKTTIRTVPRRGYLFDAPVTMLTPGRHESAPGARTRTRRRMSGLAWLAAAGLPVLIGFLLMGGTAGGKSKAASVTGPGLPTAQTTTKAVEYLSRGRFFHNRRAPGDIDRAVEAFEHAVAENPRQADAWTGLAGALWVRMFHSNGAPAEALARIRQALEQALALQPHHAEAHMRMSNLYSATGQPELSKRHFDLALEYGQNSVLVQGIAAGDALARGDLDAAIARQYLAVKLDPLGFVNRNNLGSYLFYAGRYAEARSQLAAALDLNPASRNEVAALLLAIAVLERRFDDVATLASDLDEGPARDQAMAFLHQATGDGPLRDEALARLARQAGFEAAFRLAEFHAQAGNADEGFRWLNLATDRLLTSERKDCRFIIGTEWLNSPFIVHLTGDPRWPQWLARTGSDAGTVMLSATVGDGKLPLVALHPVAPTHVDFAVAAKI